MNKLKARELMAIAGGELKARHEHRLIERDRATPRLVVRFLGCWFNFTHCFRPNPR